MTQFPNSPSVGDRVTFSNATYEWDGSRWKSLGTIAVGPTGATGPAGSGGGGGVSAGAGMTLAGSTLGIDPTATIHVAGISSDGAITAGGNFINYGAMVQSSGNANSKYGFSDGNFTWRVTNGNSQVNATITTSGFNADNGFVKAGTYVKASTYVHAGTGISLDAGGITFPDGTHQTSAASGSGGATGNTGAAGSDGTSVGYTAGNTAPVGSPTGDFWFRNDTGSYYANVFDGSTLGWLQISGIQGVTGNTGAAGSGGGGGGVSAGAGLTLNGSTLGIDPTAIVHVAGISADGGITAGGIMAASSYHNILSPNTRLHFPSADQIQAIAQGVAVQRWDYNATYITSGKLQVNSGVNLWVIDGTSTLGGLVNTQAGISMDTAGITFPDGTYQDTAASGSTITAGAGMTLAGSTLGIDPTAVVHVAGISSDGAIVIPAGNSYGWNDGSFINNASGALQFAANSGYYGAILSNSKLSVYRDAFFEDGVHVAGAAGISADKGIKVGVGITFADGTHQTSAASGSTITAGAGMTLAGSTLGIDPTAIVHVAGISSDGGITAGGDLKYSGTLNAVSTIRIQQNGQNRLTFQDASLATLGTTRFHIPYATEVLSVNALYHLAGISMSGGITFADGTHQTSAASGSTITAGAGMTLDGSTLGIDPTAIVHVAGVSSDGGVTASNVHSVGLISGGAGINLSAGNIEMANGSGMGNAANGLFRVATNELQLLPNSDTTNGFAVTSTLHYHNQKTQFKKGISADKGINLGTGITFPDGTYQTSAASGSGGATGATGPASTVAGPTGPTGATGPVGGPSITVTGGTGGPDASWLSAAATGDLWVEIN